MMKSCFFDSTETDVREYKSENFAGYFADFVSTGVYANPGTALRVIENERLTVKIQAGKCYINGYKGELEQDEIIELALPGPTLPRVDAVYGYWGRAERHVNYRVRSSEYATDATFPPVIRNGDYYEILFAAITIRPGATQITNADISNKHLDKYLCGIVTNVVNEIDTTQLYNQIESDLAHFQERYTEQLNTLDEALQEVISGDIPDNSITTPKILNNNVTREKLSEDVQNDLNNLYIHTALNTIEGTGINGWFVAAFSGYVTEMNGLNVKVGTDTGIDLEVDATYSFIITGNILNIVGSSGKDVYSTEEVKTNKVWIDGKPIYRKVFEGTIQKEIPLEISENIEIVNASIVGGRETSSTIRYIGGFSTGSAGFYSNINLTNKTISISETGISINYFKIIIEYIKM